METQDQRLLRVQAYMKVQVVLASCVLATTSTSKIRWIRVNQNQISTQVVDLMSKDPKLLWTPAIR